MHNANLRSPTARAKLATGKRHWSKLTRDLSLGFRPGARGGSWYARLRQADGRYRIGTLGEYDDHDEARTAAEAWAKAQGLERGFTVAMAASEYLSYLRREKRPSTYRTTLRTVQAHVLPALGDVDVQALSYEQLLRWRNRLVDEPVRIRGKAKVRPINPDDEDALRRRRATANRVLTVLKALLNRAHDEHPTKVPSNAAWAKLKSFRDVERPRVRYLSEAEAQRLINAAPSDFRQLIRAALYTGARYGELSALQARDVHLEAGSVHIVRSKGGKARHIPLSVEGLAFFTEITRGLPPEALVLVKVDGSPWGHHHQIRPMQRACRSARLEHVNFHALRHTYASWLAMRGVGMRALADLLGHSTTRMTELHYAHLSNNHLQRQVQHLPALGFEPDGKVVSL